MVQDDWIRSISNIEAVCHAVMQTDSAQCLIYTAHNDGVGIRERESTVVNF